jgi:5'-deoxynucleotidase YfbR-like HD superfamily hydrolase
MSQETSIQTFSGVLFDVINPTVDTVNITDIAHALSQVNRFTGHTILPYSVAEHSVHVASILPDEYKLEGLLHDASEAYIADMATPVKHSPGMAGYRDIEEDIQICLNSAFRVFPHEKSRKAVKQADRVMLKVEALSLMKQPLHEIWNRTIAGIDLPVHPIPRCWSSVYAEERFLNLFDRLYKNVVR